MPHCLLFYFEKILLIIAANDAVTAVGVFKGSQSDSEMRQLDPGPKVQKGMWWDLHLFNGMFEYPWIKEHENLTLERVTYSDIVL